MTGKEPRLSHEAYPWEKVLVERWSDRNLKRHETQASYIDSGQLAGVPGLA